jgi:hypothetical protein
VCRGASPRARVWVGSGGLGGEFSRPQVPASGHRRRARARARRLGRPGAARARRRGARKRAGSGRGGCVAWGGGFRVRAGARRLDRGRPRRGDPARGGMETRAPGRTGLGTRPGGARGRPPGRGAAGRRRREFLIRGAPEIRGVSGSGARGGMRLGAAIKLPKGSGGRCGRRRARGGGAQAARAAGRGQRVKSASAVGSTCGAAWGRAPSAPAGGSYQGDAFRPGRARGAGGPSWRGAGRRRLRRARAPRRRGRLGGQWAARARGENRVGGVQLSPGGGGGARAHVRAPARCGPIFPRAGHARAARRAAPRCAAPRVPRGVAQRGAPGWQLSQRRPEAGGRGAPGVSKPPD